MSSRTTTIATEKNIDLSRRGRMDRTYHVVKAMLREIEKYDGIIKNREASMDWEKIHMISSGRIGYMLGKRRGVDPTVASIACIVHDYGRILTGRKANHAETGYEPVKGLLEGLGFSDEVIDEISIAVRNHSKKDEIGGPLEEIVKDADVLDYYYYNGELTRPDMVRRLERLQKENADL